MLLNLLFVGQSVTQEYLDYIIPCIEKQKTYCEPNSLSDLKALAFIRKIRFRKMLEIEDNISFASRATKSVPHARD